MAARIHRTTLHEKWREKIRVSLLINNLQNHVAGRIAMTMTQIRAAEILLRKCLPDLSLVEGTLEHTHRYIARLPAPAEEAETWQQQHQPQPTIQ